MEGDHRQPPTGVQPGHRLPHHPVHRAQLVVDGDADGLEGPLGRVLFLPQGRRGHGPLDDLHQLQRGLNGALVPGPDDGSRDGGGVPLLPILPEDAPQLLLGPLVDHRPGRQGVGLIHAHIQGGVRPVGKAPGCVVQLGGGHPQIKEHAVHPVQAQPVQDGVQRTEIAVYQGDPLPPRRQPLLRRVQSRLIPVHADEPPGGQPPDNLPAVARPAQSAVQIHALRPDGQGLNALVQQHRLVGKYLLTHIRIQAPPYRPTSSPASSLPPPGPAMRPRSRSPPGR